MRLWLGAVACSLGLSYALLSMMTGLLYNQQLGAWLMPNFADVSPPIVELIGEAEPTIIVGMDYQDPGIEAFDIDSEITMTKEGEVDANTPGEYIIKYTVSDEAGLTTEVERHVKVVPNEKIVYLTFDDGPGDYTATLLDVLQKYKVKATFFVTGMGDDTLIKREYDEGHAVGIHTMSHVYSQIYANVDNYLADFAAIQERIKRVTGQETRLMRFPGGSSNTISTLYDSGAHIMTTLVAEMEARGMIYFDWNVLSGDAGEATTADEIYKNVVTALKPDYSIVLQHDLKDYSVAAVEKIIQYGQENGYHFLKLNTNSPTAHHGVNN